MVFNLNLRLEHIFTQEKSIQSGATERQARYKLGSSIKAKRNTVGHSSLRMNVRSYILFGLPQDSILRLPKSTQLKLEFVATVEDICLRKEVLLMAWGQFVEGIITNVSRKKVSIIYFSKNQFHAETYSRNNLDLLPETRPRLY